MTGPARPPDDDPQTLSRIEVRPVYTPADAPATADPAAHQRLLGLPGEPPFTRGVRPGLYRDGPWVMGMYSGQASPQETNRRIRSLLAGGQRGFSVALDLPTQNGLDSDHPLAAGEVGRVGVPIDSLADMTDLLDGIPLREVSQIRTTANAIGPIAVAMFAAAAERHGYAPTDFRLMLQNDVLKEYVARGTYVFPPRQALGFSVDVIEYCARNLPHWEPIEFCGYHIRDSGADAVQELAIAIGNGLEYIRGTVDRGLHIDDFGASLFMFLSAHQDLFEEVAKFRAARRLWSSLMVERFGATRDETRRLNLFVYTLGSPLTAQQPLNNVVRVAYQALAAALGGVQTLATSSYDEALGLPSDEAVQIALRTQQILAYETGVTRTTDPLGGSYFVESLTDQLADRVTRYLARIEDQGGALAALESGWIATELEAEAYRQQLAIDSGERTVVGVNRFAGDRPDRDIQPARADPELERTQVGRLREVRRQRHSQDCVRALRGVEQAARSGTNTVPAILTAVQAFATVGEICDALAEVWGRHGR
ncbi:MAG: methylmalonyl-CoA mutase [Micromonosporaceae bacterium]|nr:methylmalonyl-CoA mutase [Micromonosporaceae bacterium]